MYVMASYSLSVQITRAFADCPHALRDELTVTASTSALSYSAIFSALEVQRDFHYPRCTREGTLRQVVLHDHQLDRHLSVFCSALHCISLHNPRQGGSLLDIRHGPHV